MQTRTLRTDTALLGEASAPGSVSGDRRAPAVNSRNGRDDGTVNISNKIVIAAALLTLAGPVMADTPVLDQRQDNQAQRIRQVWQQGDLTRTEAARLVQRQKRLRLMEQRAEADGQVTHRERAQLQHRSNIQSRQIYRQRHDRQTRG